MADGFDGCATHVRSYDRALSHEEIAMKHKALMAAMALTKSVQDEADIGGAHYAPDFRDCLGDNREWVEMRLADALEEFARSNSKPANG